MKTKYLFVIILLISAVVTYVIVDNYHLQSQLGTLNVELSGMEKKLALQGGQDNCPVTNFRYFSSMYYAQATVKNGGKFTPPSLPKDGVWHVSLLNKYMTSDANGIPHFWGIFASRTVLDKSIDIENVFLMKLEDADGADKGCTDYLMGWYYCLEPNDRIVLTIKGDDITIARE